MPAKFYFETDQFRKPGYKLVWFGEEEGAFKVENRTYTVMGKNVSFTFEPFPGDINFIAYFNGELSNSANFFLAGESLDCKWKPWQYSQRVSIARQVDKLKKK